SLRSPPTSTLFPYTTLFRSLEEQKHLAGVAVDAVIDSVSVKTTFKESLAEKGIIFCSFSDALQEHPDLVKKYIGMAVPVGDNYRSEEHTSELQSRENLVCRL